MWIKSILFLLGFWLVHQSDAVRFRNVYGMKSAFSDESVIDDDNLINEPGSPEGSIRVRRLEGELNEKSPFFDDSYTMYVTTNQTCGSNLFGWFFQNKNASAPIVLWLQGGPGASSLFGLFQEHGPYVVYPNLTLGVREYAWTNKYSVLYIDNPVGTGFSYTQNTSECYAHVTEDAVLGLYTFLKAFFNYFTSLRGADLVITGESYGGHYVPALGSFVINQQDTSQYFTFKGIAVGNGWINALPQIDSASLLYQLALIDDIQRDNMTAGQATLRNQIINGQWLDAFYTMNSLMDGDLGIPSLFNKYTGLNYYLNFLFTNDPVDTYFIDYLNLPSTRQAIGVGNVTFSDGQLVEYYMREDICQSTQGQLEDILNQNYSVLLYNGNLDVICAPILTESMINTLDWINKKSYDKATKEIWKVTPSDTEIAGYRKKGANFEYTVLRNAGHLTPHDQPRSTYAMITRFVDSLVSSKLT